MSKVLVRVVARLSSTRLPNKSAFDLAGKPVFVHIFERLLEHYPNPDYCFLNTSNQASDDPLATLAKCYGYDVFRHALDPAPRAEGLWHYLGLDENDINITLLCDSPLIFCEHVPFAIQTMQEYNANYFDLIAPPQTLLWAGSQAKFYRVNPRITTEYCYIQGDASHVGPLIDMKKYVVASTPGWLQEPWPWTQLSLDTPGDAAIFKSIYRDLYKGQPLDIRDVRIYLSENRPGASLRREAPRNEEIIEYMSVILGCLSHGAPYVRWKGGQNKKLECDKNPKKNRGGKCVTTSD